MKQTLIALVLALLALPVHASPGEELYNEVCKHKRRVDCLQLLIKSDCIHLSSPPALDSDYYGLTVLNSEEMRATLSKEREKELEAFWQAKKKYETFMQASDTKAK